MFHNLAAADKIPISVQYQSQSIRMRTSLVCSFAFFFLAIVSEERTWSREIPTRSKVEEIDEIEYFQGDKNTLRMTQTYTWEFQCHYKLQNYPFDTQVPGTAHEQVMLSDSGVQHQDGCGE